MKHAWFKKAAMIAVIVLTISVFAAFIGCSAPDDGKGNVPPEPPIDEVVYYSVDYAAGIGGHIDGDAEQTVKENSSGTVVTAVADYGYKFSAWSDGVTSAERHEDNVREDIRVTALFSPESYSVVYGSSIGGYVDGDLNQTVEYKNHATPVTAVASEEGYEFLYWSDYVTTATRWDRQVVSDISVSAIFRKHEYVVIYSASEHGKIVGEEIQLVAIGDDSTSVTAVSTDDNYEFDCWSDGVTTATRTDVKVNSDIDVVAKFVPLRATVTYLASHGGMIAENAVQKVTLGKLSSTVTAVADNGFKFVGWSDGKTTESRCDTINEDVTYTAIFEPITDIKLVYDSDGPGYVSGEAEQFVDYGDNARPVIAVPYPGGRFVGWSDGVTTPQREDLEINADSMLVTICAKFEYLPDRDRTFTVVDMHDGYLQVSLNDDYSQSELTVPELYYGTPVTDFYCENIESVISVQIPACVTRVVIKNCLNLANIEMTNGVEILNISGCPNLKSLVVPGSIRSLYGNGEYLEHLTFGYGLKTVTRNEFQFRTYKSLKSISLPESVTTIGAYAFYYCKSLEEVNLSTGLIEIQDRAFTGCESLTNISIPSSVNKIGANAFFGCKALESVEFAANVETLGKNIFAVCKGLKNVKLPNGFTTISEGMFRNSDLEEIYIPDSVITIGDDAFYGCFYLRRVFGMVKVESIGDTAFGSAPIEYMILPSTLKELRRLFLRDGTQTVYSRLTEEQLNAINPAWSTIYQSDDKLKIIYIGDGEAPEPTQPLVEDQ